MERAIISQALEFHLDPDIRRQQGNVKNYWIELRLCLYDPMNMPLYHQKKFKLLAETDTADKLKHSIIETVVSSQFDFLLAMAYKANHDTKLHDQNRKIERLGYCFKNFLLNILIQMFAEKHKIADSLAAETNVPQLVFQDDQENKMNFDMQFFTGFTFYFCSPTQLRQFTAVEQHAIGFHLPKNQLIEPVVKILEMELS